MVPLISLKVIDSEFRTLDSTKSKRQVPCLLNRFPFQYVVLSVVNNVPHTAVIRTHHHPCPVLLRGIVHVEIEILLDKNFPFG